MVADTAHDVLATDAATVVVAATVVDTVIVVAATVVVAADWDLVLCQIL